MKKLYIISSFVLFTASLFSQPPQKMSYQCVVRNSTGILVTNQEVGVKVSIIKGSLTGILVYEENYIPNPQTNDNGLVTVEIGGGTPLTGTFSTIDWSSGPYFLKTETDPTGGTDYTISGTSQLLSVPYAFYSGTAQTANYDNLSNLPDLSGYITGETDPEVGLNSTNYIPKWNGTSLISSSVFDNGNVGIGTTVPTFPLTLEKNTFAGLSDILALNNLQSPNPANAVSINFRMRDNVGGGNELVFARIRAISTTILNPDQTGALAIDTRTNSSTLNEVMRIQGSNVGIGTTSPQGVLDVSSTSGAFIVPRMTTTQRDALTAVNGMIIYNTSGNQFNFYENGAWVLK